MRPSWRRRRRRPRRRRAPRPRRPRYGLPDIARYVINPFSFTFIEPQGALHGELNQPSPQFQADRLSLSRFMAVWFMACYYINPQHSLRPLVSRVEWHPMTWGAISGRPSAEAGKKSGKKKKKKGKKAGKAEL